MNLLFVVAITFIVLCSAVVIGVMIAIHKTTVALEAENKQIRAEIVSSTIRTALKTEIKELRDVIAFNTSDTERLNEYVNIFTKQEDYCAHEVVVCSGVYYLTVFLKTHEELYEAAKANAL